MEIAAAVVPIVLNKLDNLITAEATLLIELPGEVGEMKSELQYSRSFLVKVSRSTKELDDWVEDVREVSYDIEDVLDDYTLPRNSVVQAARRLILARRIKDIMKRLSGIRTRRDAYVDLRLDDLRLAHDSRSFDHPDASLDVRRKEIVGIEDGLKKLTELLKDGVDTELKLISVVGMAGMGKTTLVKQVYDSEEVNEWFPLKAWIPASRSCATDELLICIIEEFLVESGAPIPEGLKSRSSVQLRKMLRDLLQGKRYVIVLDDIWNIEVLRGVKNALPCGGVGSRIIVTTRMLNVKACGDVYAAEALPPEQAWKLFCKEAFSPHQKGGFLPPDLDNVGWEIVKKCDGLPLFIVEVASLLKSKGIKLIEWKKVLPSLVPELPSDPYLSRAMRTLAISYNRLDPDLRPCFMHFGIFPEGQFIKRMRLIRLWIAEGFVEEIVGRTLEEVADRYLNQLVDHSVIQVAERSDDGRVKSYKVHPFMREFILLKSREQNFCLFFARTNVATTHKIRRLSIHGKQHMNDSHQPSLSSVRTFFAFNVDASVLSFFEKFKYLRVLDLENTTLKTLPKSLTELFFLRYLSLENSGLIKVLPKDLSSLVNLGVLNLKGTSVCELPSEILNLKRMRHLLVYKYMYGDTPPFNCVQATKLPAGIGQLTALQKLSLIDANNANSDEIRELGKLTQLRRLGLVGLRRGHGLQMCNSIVNMKDLRSLSVKATIAKEPLHLYHIQPETAPPDLERIYLRGYLGKLPEWILSLQSLTRLILGWSGLEDDPFGILHQLHSLADLTLLEAYTGPLLYCQHHGKGKGGFPSLKSLHLAGLHYLQTFDVVKGAMPALQKLYINKCEHLRILPPCIGDLTKLEKLEFGNMPKEFEHDIRMKKQRGESVMHIRSIYVRDTDTYIT